MFPQVLIELDPPYEILDLLESSRFYGNRRTGSVNSQVQLMSKRQEAKDTCRWCCSRPLVEERPKVEEVQPERGQEGSHVEESDTQSL